MKKLSKLLNQLIELNSIIKQIENRSKFVEIISSDLNIFYEFSILKITYIEKAITESLLANDISKHNIILNNIKEKFTFYNDFQKKHQRILEKTNLINLIEDKLSFISHQIENTKNELEPINSKLYDLKSTISASAYSNPQSITDNLVEKETILKNKAETILKKYIELQKQKRDQELLEFLKYNQINFSKIAVNFKKAILLCKVESEIPVKKTEKYVKFSIILQIHEAFESKLFKTINADKLNQLFNLSGENLSYKIPNGYKTKFYYLIRELNTYVEKKTDDNWKDSILKNLGIKKDTWTKSSSKIINSKNVKDIDFVNKVNNIFNKIKHSTTTNC